MAGNKKSGPHSREDAIAVVAAMKFWSRLSEAQSAVEIPFIRQAKTPAPSVQLLMNLPPARHDDSQVYSLKISLKGARPEIWRRVQTRSISLESLHKIIQVVMGWQDAHLHGFEVQSTRIPLKEEGAGIDEAGVEISQFYSACYNAFQYTYDFEDNWIHDIVIEGCSQASGEIMLPSCISGEGASPHEDTGGIHVWRSLQAALKGASKIRSEAKALLKARLGHTNISRELKIEDINHRLRTEFH
ncbi:plasmid pRiA4b ORF-3 family protein [Schlesneria sp. DSM 10557]|uniref:plasmid pRiA4b ORF-3 family protein n=1 Tax=Schlesneria sp. DSM 10557 TaxID=3044399 RepID=UPI00359F2ECA